MQRQTDVERIVTDTVFQYNMLPAIGNEPDGARTVANVERVDTASIMIHMTPSSSVRIGKFVNTTHDIRRVRIVDCELQAPFDCARVEKSNKHVLMRYGAKY